MKPIAILQFDRMNHPSEFGVFLQQRGTPFRLLRLDLEVDSAAAVPAKAHEYSAYCLMGGPMMVGDDLPWMQPVLRLIGRAMEQGIPVIGHCLGAQLMAHVAGARVAPHPHHQIGWDVLQLEDNAAAQHWFGEAAGSEVPVAHWHFESFEVPKSAVRIATHPRCPDQAFAIGPHIAFQPHIELNAANLLHWFEGSGVLRERFPGGHVQEEHEVRAQLPAKLPVMQAFAKCVYAQWLEGVIARAGGEVESKAA
ncbi:MAG: type 1 glutamine amidotransferase [Burkholderiaceae bacterium]